MNPQNNTPSTQERWVAAQYTLFPKNKKELKQMIKEEISKQGPKANLNHINVSKITDFSKLFYKSDFNGDISKWDTSNATDMSGMFQECKLFNQDISNWDVSNVINMNGMFYYAESFDQDISGWDVSKVKNNYETFKYCPIEEKYKPKFK